MEFFALDDGVARLEAELAAAGGGARLGPLVELAWQLRQRDSARALAVAAEAEALLAGGEGADCAEEGAAQAVPIAQVAQVAQSVQSVQIAQIAQARLALVRGSVKWLSAELDAAQVETRAAMRRFEALHDSEGQADAHWLLAMLAGDQGDGGNQDIELAAMAGATADPVRVAAAEAARAFFAAFRNPVEARQRWGVRFALGKTGLHPAAGCWAEAFLGVSANQGSQFAEGIRNLIEAHALAVDSGQIRLAVLVATNIGGSLNSLNEHRAALEWMQRGLDLARRSGWPGMVGVGLMQTAQTLRHLQRHEAARAMLREALALLAPLAASRDYAVALRYLGEAELGCKDHDAAFATFQLLAKRAGALGEQALQSHARRGQAEALLRMGQPRQALAAADSALAYGRGAADLRIAALRVMADIYAAHSLPPPREMDAPSAPLHFLRRALLLASGIDGYIVPGDLLDAMAAAYAAIGDFCKAYDFGCQARAARETTHSQEAANRATALQVTHQSERERADAEHSRRLAESEARRAEALQQHGDTLERLGAIGQEITAHLDAGLVLEALHRHAHHLIDASCFVVYLLERDGMALNQVFGIEAGQPLPSRRCGLSDPDAFVARCVRERREIVADFDGLEGDINQVPGTRPTLSAMFAPLCRGEGVLGAITVQSFARKAYGPREQLVFRTLCSYAAIALSNAQAHQRLKEGMQEKLASLATLTAGVAHEINNPTNFAHVAAQNQRVNIGEFRQFANGLVEGEGAEEVREAFNLRFDKLDRNVGTILNGTERIRSIVKDLRAFTRQDRPESQRARVSECVQSTLTMVRVGWQDQVEFVTKLEDDPEITCWPALLNQVFMNLIVNGCQAIAARYGSNSGRQGRIVICMEVREGRLMVSISDNGSGMSEKVRARVLEPFYTTKSVGEGTGLGLSIAYGIVQKHGGEMQIESAPGQGSCFTLVLPLAAGAGGRRGG